MSFVQADPELSRPELPQEPGMVELQEEDLEHTCPSCREMAGVACRRLDGRVSLSRVHMKRRLEWDIPF